MLPSLGASGFPRGFAEASPARLRGWRVFTCSLPFSALSFVKPGCREVREERTVCLFEMQ